MTREVLHQYILDQMKLLGGITVKHFLEVTSNEPTLLTRYVNATGIPCSDVKVIDIEDGEITLKLTIENGETRVGTIRFIR